MITNISWAAYFYTVAALMAAWYLYVGFRFFYPNIKNALGSHNGGSLQWDAGPRHEMQPAAEAQSNLVAKGAFEENSFNDFEVIEELVDRVKTLISFSVEKALPKDDFLLSLRPILKDYPALRNSQFRPSINEFITTESDAQGLESLSMDEVENCWTL